ncbi:hypothetical protein C882_0435 [Caenispirillum salinarum AK4]|uniref:Uncharacterized protein n=1 Tax=Caenispirillum salinarum AK4 TaxID=1238182 RepID=K9GWJ9_9PROT|nr:hypothetical protein [Caenispirillum salinarum]EKV29612.1 hypothetical protein C882_0435 [Caenispirillum salinarum AK4]
MLDASAIAESSGTAWDRRIIRTFSQGAYLVREYEMPSDHRQLVTMERTSWPHWRKWKVSRDDTFIAETFWRWKVHAWCLARLNPVSEFLRPFGWPW